MSRYYRPELDALRFFAFLFVLCFHRMDYVPTDPTHDPWLFHFSTAGAFGVPVFFLLSAFLITELLVRERAQTGRIHVQSFYVRRILRIWPLYFLAFYGLALLAHLLPGVGPLTHSSWLAFSLFAGNWYILRHGWIAGPVDPLWSISVEEQFYIAIPLLVALGGRRALKITSALLLAVAYAVILHYALHPSTGDNGEWTNSFVQFQFFAAGTLLALVLRGRLPQTPLALRLLAIVAALACWFTALLGFGVRSWDAHPTPTGAVLGWAFVLAGCVLFFLSLLGLPERYIPHWLAYLGRISFGLYVFHSLILHLVFTQGAGSLTRLTTLLHLPMALRASLGTAIVLAATILTAHLSYQFFERPFLQLKKRFTFIPARED
ncbi:MAG TPA: acyltransferase [Edaphobacter sp.]|nr:acyltransferase [Edaphobacter sp.]